MRLTDHWPAYLALSPEEWNHRIAAARAMLKSCTLCPRECKVDRLAGEKGVCRAGAVAQVSSCNDHHGEEPPLSGTRGSGTIFFTHCNLRCVFCQNYPISHLGNGEVAGAEELADMMLKLQRRGCHNINFVTPTHMMPFILEALPLAINKGLAIPLVYNCGGYESLDSLRLLDNVVDIYLPDMKYDDNSAAKMISKVEDYVEKNREAIREMHRQVGDLALDGHGIARRGLIIRHLVLPHNLAGSAGVLAFIAREISVHTAISLMSQYFPAHKAHEIEQLSRGVTKEEYRDAVRALLRLRLENAWIQDRWGISGGEEE
ncbi:MAG TPA: radical SAM protein [bacterium]|nr:radical SAM protein [bacterium]